jgi:polyisoprenoid-binding protein YceI
LDEYLDFETTKKNKIWGNIKMAKWTVDQSHSSIGFEVKHMMVSKVKGQFESYAAEVEAADLTDLTSASIAFKLDVASINTRNDDRDNHLRSADFFDVENNPSIEFSSTSIIKDGDNYSVTGDLTIKEVTKPVTFSVEFNGKGTNPWGVEVYGFEAEAKINREEFGLTWNAALETGGVLVGKDIKIKVELEVNPAA